MFVKAAVAEKTSGQPTQPPSSYRSPTPKPWALKPGEDRSVVVPHHNFPDDRLMASLVPLYFSHVNLFLPLLHRPRFEEGMNQRLHLHDDGFASTVLLVCALGSLYLTDPGVSSQDREQLGWKWYDQVELCGHSLRRQPTLYDLQAYCLAAHFLHCTANPRACWNIVGFGLYLAQDIGAHRRKATEPKITVEEELEKRALWILLLFDAQASGALGRGTVLDPLEINVNLPSALPGENSSGLDRRISDNFAYFNCLLNLFRFQTFIWRNLYANKRSRWMEKLPKLRLIVDELDATLDTWFTSIPKHLLWDPHRAGDLLFDQSAILYCLYYYTRILLHRRFIPAMDSESPPVPSGWVIATAAARECISIADIQRRRRPNNPLLFSQSPVFNSAMVLLLKLWNDSEENEDVAEDVAYIHTSIDVLKFQREQWPSSGFF
ncbi:fungal-specific transcription factor domain-containing protein [Mycena galericulata]|nr:fungal-specific transcription factor domain-containing protein [Mycena galericulata]